MSSENVSRDQRVPFNKLEIADRMEEVKGSKQFIPAIAGNLGSFVIGTCLGWTAPIMPKIEAGNSPLDKVPSSDDQSWIGSLIALGAVFTPFVAGFLADKIGRKWTLLSSTLFFGVAYIMLAFGSQLSFMLVGRLLQGFGVGIIMTVLPMYIGEISTDEFRGALGSLMQLFIVAGILFVYAVGPYVSYITVQWLGLAWTVIFGVVFFFMPESAAYLLMKGRKSEATRALQYVRGQSAQGVQTELNGLEADIVEMMASKVSLGDLLSGTGKRALTISVGLIAFQQLSGINIVLFYATSIFTSTGSSLDPNIATIIVGVVQVLASGVTPLIADRLGRKIILMFSAVGMTIGLVLLGSYFYLKHIGSESVNSIGWLPIFSLIMFISVYCVGFGPLPWAVLGEMFSPKVKSLAASTVASVCWIIGFLITKYFSIVTEAIGQHGAFWMFGGCCVVAFVFVLTVVMETKGKSLKEIQEALGGN